jgi:hypothetical protein
MYLEKKWPTKTYEHTKYRIYFNVFYVHWINLLKTKCICVILGISPYRAVNTLRLDYKIQSVNVV